MLYHVLLIELGNISLVWPDLSFVQGIIAFSISAGTDKGLVQLTGQNGSVAQLA